MNDIIEYNGTDVPVWYRTSSGYMPEFYSSTSDEPKWMQEWEKYSNPLIRLLDFFNKILLKLTDKTADLITNLELRLFKKSRRKNK